MATINYSIKSSKNPAKIYCRFVHTRDINFDVPTSLLLNPEFWDKKQQKIRNVIDVKHRDAINRKLSLLKIHLSDQFNIDYAEGKIIDRNWLKEVIKDFFNRPTVDKDVKSSKHTLYFTSFGDWWLNEKYSTWLVGPHKYMDEKARDRYQTFIDMVKEFEGRKKIRLNETTNAKITEFVNYLSENNYAAVTIQRHISRFKFFCNRAEEEGLNINKQFKKRVYAPKPIEIKEPILDINEITKIYNHNFKNSESLDNARDNLIIACWTGLRVSDFLNQLNIDNFIDDFIEIKTQKTQTPVVIPVHPMVKRILIKRNGQLPDKISDQKFNKNVKTVCKKAGINKMMKGKLYDKEKKRKVVGVFKKWELVSSHIGRRSFATNHYGKIPNSVIMNICGWADEKMMLHYIKKSNKEHAVELKKYWEEIYN